MTCYIVIAEGPDGSIHYGNRNKLMKNRGNACVYSSPGSAKITAKRLLIMHPAVKRAVVCVYNAERHPDIMPILVTRAASAERPALVS